jgi:oligopeptidase A
VTANNPLLNNFLEPKFDKINPEHLIPAVNVVLEQMNVTLTEIENSPEVSWAAIFEPLEEVSRSLDSVWGVAGHLLAVKNSDELRKAYNSVQSDVVEASLRLSQSRIIYEKLLKLKASPDWSKFTSAQQRTVEQSIRDAKMSGIDLQGDKKERFNQISKRLAELSTNFSNNVLDAIKAYSLDIHDPADMEGMPDSAKEMAASTYNRAAKSKTATKEGGPWRITLDAASYGPFLQYNQNRKLREELYRASITKASIAPYDNEPLIYEILALRQEKAKLLGFKTFAEQSLAKKMAGDVAEVEALLEKLRSTSRNYATKELVELKEFAKSEGLKGDLEHWDVAFYTERLKEKRLGLDEEVLRPYFPMEQVLSGLFDLIADLFEVKIKAADGEAPIWQKDVRYFKIFDTKNQHIASFYLDPYSRPEDKRGGAWMNVCVNRGKFKGTVYKPVAYIVCNGTPPIGDNPSLLNFREVTTLFHEFGHALQHMLTDIDYYSVAGIHGVEWDAVELPSQFMENWVYHTPTLKKIAKHYKTGEVLPDKYVKQLNDAKTFQAGMQMVRQLYFGMLDLELHHRYDPKDKDKRSIFDIGQEIAGKTLVRSPLKEDRFLCGFSHIFAGGYAAGYYSYKWAEVLSADAFSAFEEAGLDHFDKVKQMGRKFRDTVLALGGSVHPREVFKQFRGREPKPDALLKHSGMAI